MAYKRPRSAADKEAARQRKVDQLTAMHDQLTAAVEALRGSEAWTAWLDTAAKFHHYSLNNQLLIAGQRPDATLVAGYEAWKTHGRQVRKGEKGIRILAPITRRRDPDPTTPTQNPTDAGETGEVGKRVIAGFTSVAVFDVNQTDGDPLPAQPRPELLTGQAPDGLWDDLAAQVTAAGFTLQRADTAAEIGGANGVTDYLTKTVTVRADVSDAQAVKTLAHELGHVLLHSPDSSGRPDCRGIIEVEAESVAYLVATHHGLDTGDYSFAYIAGWADATDDPTAALRSTAERVRGVAAQVLADPTPINRDAVVQVAERATRSLGLADAAQASAGRAAGLTGPTAAQIAAANRDAQEWFQAQAAASPDWAQAVRDRGIDPSVAARLGIGWAPDTWTDLTNHLRRLGHSDATLTAASLSRTASTGRLIDTNRGRITFPYITAEGNVVGFTGRLHGTHPQNAPKYLNSGSNDLFSKGQHLYGMHNRTPATVGVVLVEGPWDAAAVTYATSGHHLGISTNGTALTTHQAQHIADLGLPVTVWTDPDTAGRDAAVRAHDVLQRAGVTDPRLVTTNLTDPSDYHRMFGPVATTDALTNSRPLAHAVIDQWLDEVREHGLHRTIETIRQLGPIVRPLTYEQQGEIAQHIAQRTGLQPTTVATALTEGTPHPGRPQGAASAAPTTTAAAHNVNQGSEHVVPRRSHHSSGSMTTVGLR